MSATNGSRAPLKLGPRDTAPERKTRPLIMTGDSVRATLAGKKTQTRRLVNPQPPEGFSIGPLPGAGEGAPQFAITRSMSDIVQPIRCPYGVPGDFLWIREGIWRRSYYGKHFQNETNAEVVRGTNVATDVRYKATDTVPSHDEQAEFWEERSPRFFPRFACRLVLQITKVRLERLQAITEEDARAEGIDASTLGGVYRRANGDVDARSSYGDFWDLINGARAAWATNPLVWALSFCVKERR